VSVSDILNAHRYIHNSLEPVLAPFMQTLPKGSLQLDNARPQTANIGRTYLQQAQLQMLPWPAPSPDLSLIEHLWDMIGRRLRLLPRAPNNVDVLRYQLDVIWNEIPKENIDHLIESMPRRVNACIAVHRDVTHY
jgi:hypothetical protein